mmetsp:Transcript_28202/g.24918  ORF Transcript_28202/g.24918 Transcript_28202/m.24918 type:complete len:129 (+) Transcript_28202:327-713(+)
MPSERRKIESSEDKVKNSYLFKDTKSQTVERTNSTSSIFANNKYDITLKSGLGEYKRDLSNSHSKMKKRKDSQLQVVGRANPISKYNVGAHANFACPPKMLPQLGSNNDKNYTKGGVVYPIKPLLPRW